MSDTLYSARFSGPTLIERNKAQTVSVTVARDGSAPTISSATFTLYDSGGTKVIDATAATIAAGVVTMPVTSPLAPAASDTVGFSVTID